ncbi:translational activator of cytochrome c oxidase 1 [Phlebotomus argentipes]|uniref:translational activator of cytochrome c oxidase 1 n=1 Tax=Phlebotomus argentipes TaxID=94469 RepID=UPI0028937360|nr:translational activator of cytochrome c oxidase 1 [Phlebotomus argentipes]
MIDISSDYGDITTHFHPVQENSHKMIFQRLLVRSTQQNILSICGIHTGSCYFAGHSKWANIRHTKAAKDGQKSLLFARFARQIRLAIQEGKSANPAVNSLLKHTIDAAVKKQVPMATIQTSIKKASSQGATYKRYVLEVKAVASKVYVMLVLYTDNVALAKANLQTVMKKTGSSYAELKHLFTETGIIVAVAQDTPAERLLEDATDHAILVGAEEVDVLDEKERLVHFTCSPAELLRIRKELEELKYEVESAEHVYIPHNYVQLNEAEKVAYQHFRTRLNNTVDCIDEIFDNIEENEDQEISG